MCLSSHCDTCKQLSGSVFTLNQIIPKDALKVTKGDDLGKYTYYGDSGRSFSSFVLEMCLPSSIIPNSYARRTPTIHE